MSRWLLVLFLGWGMSTQLLYASDPEEKAAVERAISAANSGDIDAQVSLCRYYGFWGEVERFRPPKGYDDWCETTVRIGDVSAMSNYAHRLENGIGVLENQQRAIEIYLKAAEKGGLWAHTRLGFFRSTGIGLPKDEGKSCKHYQEGAKEYPVAQEGLAACYEDGAPGFPKDIKKAITLYEQSASGKYLANFAHYRLGYLHFFGVGTERNPRIAAKWLNKGANQEYGRLPGAGYYILGLMYEDGDGLTKNDEDAYSSYLKGAEAGHPASQNKVGAKYAEGKGTAKDLNKALMWFTISAANGFKDAAENRDKAEKMLKPPEIKRAQKLAKEWLDKHPSN